MTFLLCEVGEHLSTMHRAWLLIHDYRGQDWEQVRSSFTAVCQCLHAHIKSDITSGIYLGVCPSLGFLTQHEVLSECGMQIHDGWRPHPLKPDVGQCKRSCLVT